MAVNPQALECPSCGAPLELDVEGRCRWCEVPVLVAPAPAAGRTRIDPFDDQLHLVPDSVDEDDLSLPPGIANILTTLSLLGREVAVQDYLDQVPGLRQGIRTLSAVVSGAGRRIRDSGQGGDQDNPANYTPDEIWATDLALDVVALLGVVEGGVSGSAQAAVRNTLGIYDKEPEKDPMGIFYKVDLEERRTWQRLLDAAGPGLDAFREMREQVPARPTKAQPAAHEHKRRFFG
jgi:hypothetical protein